VKAEHALDEGDGHTQEPAPEEQRKKESEDCRQARRKAIGTKLEERQNKLQRVLARYLENFERARLIK
tara:strand:+ start:504 stop:707 length:204 start_codon:yes stop_codon:yes gene_type:complete